MSLYLVDGIPLDDAERSTHERMVAAALAGRASLPSSEGAQDAAHALTLGDEVVRAYRARETAPREPSYRLTPDARSVEEFLFKEGGQKKIQCEILNWMLHRRETEPGSKATHSEIRIGTGCTDGSIIALTKRRLLIRVGLSEGGESE